MPVFLMAIATDSVHIFNEFYFRLREVRDRRVAVTDTPSAVGRPVRYTALATAAGFAVLAFMHIIPVRVFGATLEPSTASGLRRPIRALRGERLLAASSEPPGPTSLRAPPLWAPRAA